jgi:hypothetical protein
MNIDEFVTKVIAVLKANRIDFLIHGAVAVGIYGFTRATQDLDIIIITPHEKIEKVLVKNGFTKLVVKMTESGLISRYQLGDWVLDIFVEERRIEWAGLKRRAFKTKWHDYTVKVISKKDLIANKKKRASSKDLLDIHMLEYSDK